MKRQVLTAVLLFLSCATSAATAGEKRHRAPLKPGEETMRPQNAGQSWSYVRRDRVRRFELRAGDHWSEDGTAPKERTEAFSSVHLTTGRRYRITFDLAVAPGAPNSAEWMTLVQLQSTFDPGEAGHSPPFAIELNGEQMQIVTRSSAARISTPADTKWTKHYKDARPIERGRWYAILIDVTFDPAGKGVLRVTRDGVQLVDYHGALGFDDAIAPYLKQGIYRALAPETIVAYFTEPEIMPIKPGKRQSNTTPVRNAAPARPISPPACR